VKIAKIAPLHQSIETNPDANTDPAAKYRYR
jgi:hypothetical protein